MTSQFTCLVRFLDHAGNVTYGDIPSSSALFGDLVGQEVTELSGNPFSGLKRTGNKKTIKKVLCPLPDTPIFQCIGVNYAKHAEETNFKVPSQPIVFSKPADSISGPYDDVVVHPDAQPELDYEGELCFIFKKDAKDVSEADALSYVLGYAVGNDLSARNYIPQEVSGFQMSYGKSFDAFAPLGPAIVSSEEVGDPHSLRLVTKVNGEVRQDENTSDMIWKIPQIIAHLTRGRTVRAGTVCMTGTPSGVAWFMQPQGWLKDGDVTEVTIDKLGTMRHKVSFKY